MPFTLQNALVALDLIAVVCIIAKLCSIAQGWSEMQFPWAIVISLVIMEMDAVFSGYRESYLLPGAWKVAAVFLVLRSVARSK